LLKSPIRRDVLPLGRLGLGYLTLGQPSSTLSGGEAQRLKLARELTSKGKSHCVYILDEPSTGLHISDYSMLTSHLRRLIDQDNTVVVIEHNFDIISAADWIIELGPGGGRKGGKIVFSGTPEEFLGSELSSPIRSALEEFLADTCF